MAENLLISLVRTLIIGMAIILPLFMLIFFHKKMPLPFWKKHRLQVFTQDGVDTQPIFKKEYSFWQVREKGINWFWVCTRLPFFGFFLDYGFDPCIRNFNGVSTLRLIERKAGVMQSSNFYPHPADFPEAIDYKTWKASLSSSTEDTNRGLEQEKQRAYEDDLLSKFGLPAMGMIFIIAVLIMTYIHAENMYKEGTSVLYTATNKLTDMQERVYFSNCLLLRRQYSVDCNAAWNEAHNTTVNPAAAQTQQNTGNLIPFTAQP
jgi:hypothetical protein